MSPVVLHQLVVRLMRLPLLRLAVVLMVELPRRLRLLPPWLWMLMRMMLTLILYVQHVPDFPSHLHLLSLFEKVTRVVCRLLVHACILFCVSVAYLSGLALCPSCDAHASSCLRMGLAYGRSCTCES
jgi:hypothetical protein